MRKGRVNVPNELRHQHIMIRGRGDGLKPVAFLTTFLIGFLVILNHHISQLSESFDSMRTSTGAVFATGLLGSASASFLYVTSYAGTVTTLNLVQSSTKRSTASLQTVATSTACGSQPSWLNLDFQKSFVYCLDEAWDSPNGAVTSFYTGANGSLTPIDRVDLIGGPVSIAEYGVGGSGLAIASYAGSGLNVVAMTPEGGVDVVQNFTFTLDQPGPDPVRQDVPHPHQAILDPTAAFILVPDLGADLVRIYQADAGSLTLTPVEPLGVKPGSGPRHGVFKTALNTTFFYLVSELANTITGYEVLYHANKTLGFSELFVMGTHGDNKTLPVGTGAAEIHVSPDEKFLIVSSRWEYSMNITNFDPNNSTMIRSDPIINYAIDNHTGSLKKLQEVPAGGAGPRHFSLNADGNLLAVGLQGDGRVAIIERDVQTGMLGDFVATVDVPGEVNTVIFNEDYHVKRRTILE
ncbi:putative isomerase YbhE [Xylariaceae sp. FL1019]|nr:putative isomerase YbhE [Xylariaceae sp. FL1019]